MKFFAILILLFSFTACGNNAENSNSNIQNNVSNQKQSSNNNQNKQQKEMVEEEVNSIDSEELIKDDNLNLFLPQGFNIEVLTDQVSNARVLTKPDELGNRWLSRTKDGIVSLLEFDENGEIANISDVFTNLNNPHGLAIDPQDGLVLYIAEEDKVSKVNLYTEGQMEKLIDLPPGGRHFTRTLHFGPDGKLYVSIGSSCDTCVEDDPRYATVYRMNKDGSEFELYADGLRNAVFLTTNDVDGSIWVTEMGRDFLGDDLPPDEINVLKEGANYGWPYCYGKNVKDTQFSDNGPDCSQFEPSKVNLQAHSAPLGLDFVVEEGWPEQYWYNLMVAFHGSWNRTVPTGYKIQRIIVDENGNVSGQEPFIEGWLTEQGQVTGRPVDVVIEPGGIMYITDDFAGRIYKVTRNEQV